MHDPSVVPIERVETTDTQAVYETWLVQRADSFGSGALDLASLLAVPEGRLRPYLEARAAKWVSDATSDDETAANHTIDFVDTFGVIDCRLAYGSEWVEWRATPMTLEVVQ